MKTLVKSIMAASLIAFSGAASAGIIDFAAIADTPPGERAIEQVAGDNVFEIAVDGIWVTVTSANDPYLDSGNAGLGVCSTGLTNTNQCSDSGDDNVTSGESVTLSFSTDMDGNNGISVSLGTIIFRNADHGITFVNGSMINIRVDGGTWMTLSLIHVFDGSFLGDGRSFEFRYNNAEFYISSVEIPEPATFALFGLGLLGAGLARRRKAA